MTKRCRRPWLLVALLTTGCDGKKPDPPVDQPPPPGRVSPLEIGTKVGNGRVVSVTGVDVSTSTKWSRVYPIDRSRLVVAGDTDGEAAALLSNDRGATWSAYAVKAEGIATWSVGADGTVVLAQARRQIPDRPPPAGTKPPIDGVTLRFAAPGQAKMSTPVVALRPDPGGQRLTIPRGDGLPTVLGPSLASMAVELEPSTFALAFVGDATEAPRSLLPLPKGEVPVNAPFGHPPQLLTVKDKQLLTRPWPSPSGPLAEPKAIDKIDVSASLVDELSAGPECEWGAWSFSQIKQPGNKRFVLGVAPHRSLVLELPPSVVLSSQLGCSAEKIAFEYLDAEQRTRIKTCSLDGACVEPQNHPFVQRWEEPHERKLSTAITQNGLIAVQELRTKVKWAVILAESMDGGKLWAMSRPVGEGEGGNPEDGYDVGALIPLGDRTLMLMSAQLSQSPRRAWYAMASDDGGSTWILP